MPLSGRSWWIHQEQCCNASRPTRTGSAPGLAGVAQVWPPFTVAAGSKPVTASGLVGTFATTNLPDGTNQVTYNGSPLYLFTGDKAAGTASGQGVEGKWFVVTVSATPSTGGRHSRLRGQG